MDFLPKHSMHIQRDNDAKQIRSIRKLLHGNLPMREDSEPKFTNIRAIFICAFIGLIMWVCLFLLAGCSYAYTVDQYADALRRAWSLA